MMVRFVQFLLYAGMLAATAHLIVPVHAAVVKLDSHKATAKTNKPSAHKKPKTKHIKREPKISVPYRLNEKPANSALWQSHPNDAVFLAAKKAADNNAYGQSYVAQVGDHALAPYVQYWAYKGELQSNNPPNDDKILAFLQEYQGSYVAQLLRLDWLPHVAERQNWSLFLQEYAKLHAPDDPSLACYQLLAQQQGDSAQILSLLIHGREWGSGCGMLADIATQQGVLTPEHVWNRLRMLAQENDIDSAIETVRLLANAPKFAEFANLTPPHLARLFKQPKAWLQHNPNASSALVSIALGQQAWQDPDEAKSLLATWKNKLSTSEQAYVQTLIASALGKKLDRNALADIDTNIAAYLGNTSSVATIPTTQLGDATYLWLVRATLKATATDPAKQAVYWALLDKLVQHMPAALKQDNAWVYWRGRALYALGKTAEAQALWRSLADRGDLMSDFYAVLAAEELGKRAKMPPEAKASTEAEIAQARKNPAVKRVFDLLRLNQYILGVREWGYLTRSRESFTVSDRQVLALAEVARQEAALDRAIAAAERTKQEHKFHYRYLMPYLTVFKRESQNYGVDMSWAYGISRAESRFVADARSSAGARGLMQVMPATAKQIARQYQLKYHPSQIQDPNVNIGLGIAYLAMMAQRFDGSQVLASAAYNAGPNRSTAWRANYPNGTEAAIFIENIPFQETRDYVKRVTVAATWYAALTSGQEQSLKQRLGKISP